MKKTTNLLLCIISMLTILGCGEQKKEDLKMEKQEQEQTEYEEDAKEPNDIISLEDAKILCTNYEDRRVNAIIEFEKSRSESNEKFVPTQFIDFDLKTIKQYIRYVEKQARKAKVKPDSLRIYLGNYGPDGRDTNRNTVFLLPTTTIDGSHGGFYINGKGKAELIRSYWPKDQEQGEGSKAEASIIPNINPFQGGKSLILNYGTGGPPPTGDF